MAGLQSVPLRAAGTGISKRLGMDNFGCFSALTATQTLPMVRALNDRGRKQLRRCWHRSCVGVEAPQLGLGSGFWWAAASPASSF
jgi:hypothetical protein